MFSYESFFNFHHYDRSIRNISMLSEEEEVSKEKNDIIFTPIINEYINSNEDNEQDEFNEESFSKNIKNDFYKENISEFEKNLSKIDAKIEKHFQYFITNLENNSNSSLIHQNNSKINDISFYDNDLDKTIQNLSNLCNKDNSFFSNKKRGRSPKYKKDLSKINDIETQKIDLKKNLFIIKNNYKIGRKRKESGLKGKHDKYNITLIIFLKE